MSLSYAPVVGSWRILETNSFRQLRVPLAPRELKACDALWLNTYTSSNNAISWVEPALNSPSGYSTLTTATNASTPTTYASTSSTAQAEQRAFAALFIGLSQAHRTPRSFNKYLQYATPNTAQSIMYDSTAPYITVVTAGIADVPLQTPVPTGYGYAVDTGITLAAFLNTSTGFVDASGITVVATKYYLYNNAVAFTTDAASVIARLVKNVKAGDTTVRVEFSSFMSVPASGQVAGVLIQ
jgi:hypothetical protein